MIAEEISKKEPHLCDTSSEEDYIADVEDEDEEKVIIIEQAYLAEEIDEDDNEEECCVGLKDKIKETKVDSQLSLSIISDDNNVGKDPPEMVSWEESNQ